MPRGSEVASDRLWKTLHSIIIICPKTLYGSTCKVMQKICVWLPDYIGYNSFKATTVSLDNCPKRWTRQSKLKTIIRQHLTVQTHWDAVVLRLCFDLLLCNNGNRLSKKSLVLFNMARTSRDFVARSAAASQPKSSLRSLYGFSAVKLVRSTCGKSIKDREITFEKVYSKTYTFILKWNSRYTSCIMGAFTHVKSGEAKYSQDYISLKSERVYQ